jgi:hypothetical protein
MEEVCNIYGILAWQYTVESILNLKTSTSSYKLVSSMKIVTFRDETTLTWYSVLERFKFLSDYTASLLRIYEGHFIVTIMRKPNLAEFVLP